MSKLPCNKITDKPIIPLKSKSIVILEQKSPQNVYKTFFFKLKTWYTDLNVQELRHRNYNGSVDKMSSIDKN